MKKRTQMSDFFKDSASEIILILMSAAILMVMVYFQQSLNWNHALKSRDQKISGLNDEIARLEHGLAQARDTIAGLTASSQTTIDDLKAAREIIGELESERQKTIKETALMGSALQQKNNDVAELNARIAEIRNTVDAELAAKDRRITELENAAADQNRRFAEVQETIRRLEASEKALQSRVNTADQAYTDLSKRHESLLEEFANIKKAN